MATIDLDEIRVVAPDGTQPANGASVHQDPTPPPVPTIEEHFGGTVGPIVDIELFTEAKATTYPDETSTYVGQEPKTARIFLCSTSREARRVFKRLGDDDGAEYVKKNIQSSLKNEIERYQTFGSQVLSAYNPCDLAEWISVGEKSYATIVTADMVWSRGVVGPPGDLEDVDADRIIDVKWIVQCILRISRDDDHRLTVVCFNLADLYDIVDHRLRGSPYIKPVPFFNRAFRLRLLSDDAFCRRRTPAIEDFTTLLLLDALAIDLASLAKSILRQPRNKPVTYLFPNVYYNFGEEGQAREGGYLSERLTGMEYGVRYFDFLKRLVEQAEDIHDILCHLEEDSATSSSKSSPSQSQINKPLNLLSTRSLYLLRKARGLDKLSEERFSLHAQMSQDHQAQSMAVLTIISAIFLPLSLAAGVLSMQTRFRDLDLLLYDFGSVACLFFTLAWLGYYLGQSILRFRFKLWHLRLRMWQEVRTRDITVAIRGCIAVGTLIWAGALVVLIKDMSDPTPTVKGFMFVSIIWMPFMAPTVLLVRKIVLMLPEVIKRLEDRSLSNTVAESRIHLWSEVDDARSRRENKYNGVASGQPPSRATETMPTQYLVL